MALWPKNYALEVGADKQKILRYMTRHAFLRIIYNLSIFSLGCIKITRGVMPPSLVPFLAHLSYMKDIILRPRERLRSIVIAMSVCGSVCLSVYLSARIYPEPHA